MTRPSDLMKADPSITPEPETDTTERALLIVQDVVCACGSTHREEELVFKTGTKYSYECTQSRFHKLRNKEMPIQLSYLDCRIVPLCAQCPPAHLTTIIDQRAIDNIEDQHLEKMIKRARRPPRLNDEELAKNVEDLLNGPSTP